jgi:putative aminopeptidase FrvX
MKTMPASEYRIGRTQLDLLEELCNANGVSGDEGEVREIIRKRVSALADEIKIDAMGNCWCGSKPAKALDFA